MKVEKKMKTSALITIACLALVGKLEAGHVNECKSDLVIALADMYMPDDITSLVEKIRHTYPGKPLVRLGESELAGKFIVPSECSDYVNAIDDLMSFESCAEVNMDEKLTERFLAGIAAGSALDTFLGAMKACVEMTNTQ